MKLVKKIIIYIIVIGLMFGFVLGMLSMNLKKVYALEKKEKIVLEDCGLIGAACLAFDN